MHQADKHNEMLYEMDTKMTFMNKTIQHIMWNLDTMRYEMNLLHFFQNKLYRVYTSLYVLQSHTEYLFEYMRDLALTGIESYDYSPCYSKEYPT